MTYDPNAGAPPMGHMEQKSSGKKWLLFGGCGCLAVLLLCGGGIGATYWFVGRPAVAFMAETMSLAKNSQAISDALGDPVEINEQPSFAQSTEDGKQIMEYRFNISGSETSGVLIVKASMGQNFQWTRESMILELEDGTEIDVDPDAELQLDIDTGDLE